MRTYNFRGQEMECEFHWLDDSTFVFQFGDGELEDVDGDECFLMCEYHVDTDKYVILVWYAEDTVPIYSEYADADTFPILFPLTREERMMILAETKKCQVA